MRAAVSAFGTKRTSEVALHMSAFRGKADMTFCTAYVRFQGQSGHDVLHCICPLLTQSGHAVPHALGCPVLDMQCRLRRNCRAALAYEK
jgi:hypothetical protein